MLSRQEQITALNFNSPRREFYGTAVVQLSSHSVALKVGTAPGCETTPSEDSLGISLPNPDSLRCFVQDGVSSKFNCEERPGLLTSHFIRNFLKQDRSELHPATLLLSANAALKEFIERVREERPVLKDAPFAAAGTIVEINSATRQLTFGHVPDSFLIIRYVNGDTALLTRDTNHDFDQKVMQVLKKVTRQRQIEENKKGGKEVITPKSERYHPEVVAKHREVSAMKGNKPDGTGTGLINGDELLSIYIQGGDTSFSLDKIDAFLLGTDGAIPLGVDLTQPYHRSTLLAQVKEFGIKGLIDLKRGSERKDPNWTRFPRFKDSDDATAIFGEVSLLPEEQDNRWPRRADVGLASESISFRGER
jgi:hypothetical protein